MPAVDASDAPAPPSRPAGTTATRRRREVLGATAPLATLGVVVALVGVAILALPVHSPLQDCGTAFGFLVDGRVDVYGDPANPPEGLTRAEVEATNAKPCRPRVADRARPAAVAILSGLVLAVAAAIVEIVVRWRRASGRSRRVEGARGPRIR